MIPSLHTILCEKVSYQLIMLNKMRIIVPAQLIFVTTLLILIGYQQVNAQIKLDVGGYMQNWYIAEQKVDVIETSIDNLPVLNTRTETTQGFRIRRARITARGQLNERFSATTWIEFAGSNPSLLDFHVDAKLKSWLSLRAGQFMMPGQSHDTARLVSSRLIFYERSPVTTRLSDRMGYSAFRDIGVMAYGQHGRLWYGIHVSNGAGRFNHAGSVITERKTGSGLYGARVDVEAVDGLTLGAHFATNQQRDVVQSGSDPFDIDRTSWSLRVATSDLGIDGLFSQIEFMSLDGKDGNRGVLLNNNGAYKLHGFYAELGYQITRNWHILARYDEMTEEPVQSGPLRLSDPFSSDNITLGVSRFIFDDNKELARIHLNYSFGKKEPMELDQSILVLVFQLRFIP